MSEQEALSRAAPLWLEAHAASLSSALLADFLAHQGDEDAQDEHRTEK